MHASLLAFSILVSLAHAAPSPKLEISTTTVRNQLALAIHKGQPLKQVYATLHHDLGPRAIETLLEIANDEKAPDETRWAALFGVARLSGKESAAVLKKFMSNSNWMLRDAALKATAALNIASLKADVERRLKDDALIVRTTAVQTLTHLKSKTSAPKLVEALFDPMNYYGTSGKKGLWIHKYILQALIDFRYEPAVPRLVELLKSSTDTQLQTQIIATLETLTGKSFPGKAMPEQIYLWKRNTVSELSF